MRFAFVFLLFISVQSFGQWKDFIISVRGDTLNRVDMKGKKQGPWVIHVDELRGEPGYENFHTVHFKKPNYKTPFQLAGSSRHFNKTSCSLADTVPFSTANSISEG